MKVIRDVLPDDGIVVDEVTQLGYIIWYGYPVHQPRRLIIVGLLRHAGLRLPHRAGRQGRQSRPPGGVGHRRRRLPVRRLGPRDRHAVRHQPGHRGGEQRLLRQRDCATSSASTRAGTPARCCTIPTSRPMPGPSACRLAGRDRRRLPRRAARGAGQRLAGGDRGRLRHRQGLSALQVPPAADGYRAAYVSNRASRPVHRVL